jgi:acyl-CoA reductase-like NAD-dependent aldehyde dehydrogenase
LIEETGKSRFDAYTSEIFAVCDLISYYKGASKKILRDKKVHTPIFLMGKKSRIVYEPLGTILVITPWNYPFFQGIVPSILAFIAGNSVIVKPSELTPLQGLWEKMISESGFPQDAIQFAYGGRETGAALMDKRPDKIHFTGSVRAGKIIMAKAAEQLIPVDLELGGKDPSIVFDDVHIERTVNGVMWGAFTTAGQSCTSLERLYIQDTIYDEFLETLVDRTKKLRTSNANRDTAHPDECDVGAITSPAQVRIIEEHIQEALDRGATLHCGGITEKGSHHMLPTILSNVDHSMKVASEETFGPVIAVMKFKTEEEAIDLANDSPYGLAASVWSKDLKRAERVAKAIKTGNVSINNHMITEANAALPFGGVKDSGIGRYKGDEGLTTFSNSKSILTDKQGSLIDAHWYPFTIGKWNLLTGLSESYFRRKKNWIKFAKNGLQADAIGKKEKIK